MRIFVSGTGRCGTVTFFQACQRIENYTSCHTPSCHDLEYPDNSITIDPLLFPAVPTLKRNFPDAVFVHLIRNRIDCVRSLSRLRLHIGKQVPSHPRLMDWHRTCWGSTFPPDSRGSAERFYDFVNDYLAAMHAMPNTHRVLTLHLEDMKAGHWRLFWDTIGAEGDFEKALAQWDICYNATPEDWTEEYEY